MTTGVVFYRGPSLLTGDPVVGIATGISGESMNAKTGPMIQTWVLRIDTLPFTAVRANTDDAVCGDCALRGRDGKDRKCYVSRGPDRVYKSFIAGQYPDVSWRELQAVVEGRAVRLCAYGDPAALPFEVWVNLLDAAATWTGYTHAYRRCDQRFKRICMASVDSVEEFYQARALGWRTFRIRRTADDPIVSGSYPAPEVGQFRSESLEFVCPASDEADHRSTCERCQLCRGVSSPARNVVIVAHGKPSTLKAFGIDVPFFKRRDEVFA